MPDISKYTCYEQFDSWDPSFQLRFPTKASSLSNPLITDSRRRKRIHKMDQIALSDLCASQKIGKYLTLPPLVPKTPNGQVWREIRRTTRHIADEDDAGIAYDHPLLIPATIPVLTIRLLNHVWRMRVSIMTILV